jgi:hypothetical protein
MPAVRTRPPARPAVRLRAVPPLDPPFDDELAGPAWPAGLDGQLALPLADLALPIGAPRPDGWGRPGPVRAPGTPIPLPPEALATASAEARQAARRFLHTCLEIFNGYRPAAHVRPLSAPADATAITEQLVAATRRLTDGRPGARQRGGSPAGPSVRPRLLRVCEPRPGVAEAAAAIGAAGQTWAMAFRLERRRGHWFGTVAQLL